VVFGHSTNVDGGGRLLLLRDWTWCTVRHVLHGGAHPPVWVFRSRASAQRAIRHYGSTPCDRDHMTAVRVD
jgi:hypothetical protein